MFRVLLIGLVVSVVSQGSSVSIDEAAAKKELTKVAIEDLYNTSHKVRAREVVKTEILSFETGIYGKDLKTYAMSFNYIELKAQIRLTITRGGNTCDAVINVTKLTKRAGHDQRTDFLFSASEWPYCIR